MALTTKGFVDATQLNRHFSEHGADFGSSSVTDYEKMADEFLGGPLASDVKECKRSRGDRVRYNLTTQAYGVIDSNDVIRTFFKPVPCSSIPSAQRSAIKLAGRCHAQANNLLYFQEECKRW
jgi:pyocin large subunit-like protein